MPNRKNGITEEKAKRIAVGATVAGVLLIIFLLVIIIFQVVIWGQASAREKRLKEQIEEYSQLTDRKADELEWYQGGEGLYYLARRMGYK